MIDGGFLKLPNSIIQEVMGDLDGNSFKVYMLIYWKVSSWRKNQDAISLTQFIKFCGCSRNTVIHSIAKLEKMGLISVVRNDKKTSEYSISKMVIDDENRFNNCTSAKSELVQNLNHTSAKFEPEVVQNLNHTSAKFEPTKDNTKDNIKYIIKDKERTDVLEVEKDDVQDDVKIVFSYWKNELNHQRSKLSGKKDKKAMKISARLKDGYSVEELKLVVDGVKKSPFHMGGNSGGNVLDSIDLIFRNAEQVDKFIGIAKRSVRGISAVTSRNINAANEFIGGDFD